MKLLLLFSKCLLRHWFLLTTLSKGKHFPSKKVNGDELPQLFIRNSPVGKKSSIAYDLTNDIIYYSDGTKWIPLSKEIVAGSGIIITDIGTGVLISADSTEMGSTILLTSAGGSETLVSDGTGPDLSIKGITAGTRTHIELSGTSSYIGFRTINTWADWWPTTIYTSAGGSRVSDTAFTAYGTGFPQSDLDGLVIPTTGSWEVTMNCGARLASNATIGDFSRAQVGLRVNGSDLTNNLYTCAMYASTNYAMTSKTIKNLTPGI